MPLEEYIGVKEVSNVSASDERTIPLPKAEVGPPNPNPKSGNWAFPLPQTEVGPTYSPKRKLGRPSPRNGSEANLLSKTEIGLHHSQKRK